MTAKETAIAGLLILLAIGVIWANLYGAERYHIHLHKKMETQQVQHAG